MYKVGDKFIIEIGEKYNYAEPTENAEQEESPEVLYRIKGFNSLTFDEKGLKRLTSYNEEFDKSVEIIADAEKYGYEKGLNDGWECAKKIGLSMRNGGIGVDNVSEVFGTTDTGEVIRKTTPQEAIEKLKEWEEKQEIQVGDVMDYSNVLIIATYINKENGTFSGIDANGENYISRRLSDCKKTGKHIDLTEIFKGLEGEDV